MRVDEAKEVLMWYFFSLTISNGRLTGEAYIALDLLTGAVIITELEADFSIGEIKVSFVLC